MTRLTPTSYVDHLRRESMRFLEVLTDCDPGARVPACPDWDADDLLWHLTGVQWDWSQRLRERPAGPDEDAVRPDRPSDHAGLVARFSEFSAELVGLLDGVDPSEPAWSWADFVPDGQTVGFIQRRQAHEALIHRLDAEQTAGVAETPLDAGLAADGVAECLEVMYGGAPASPAVFEPLGPTVRVDLTDTGTALWVAPGTYREAPGEPGGPHLVVTSAGHEPAAVVAGRAEDVDAWLWKRRDDGRVTTTGAAAVLAAFRAAVDPPLD